MVGCFLRLKRHNIDFKWMLNLQATVILPPGDTCKSDLGGEVRRRFGESLAAEVLGIYRILLQTP